MTVYLLHLDKPLSRGVRSRDGKPLTAGHYIGFTDDLISRIDDHVSTTWRPLEEPCTTEDGRKLLGVKHGQGSTFMGVVNSKGIDWRLARTWDGELADRSWERKLKKWNNAPRFCPICNPETALHYMKLPAPEPKSRRRVRRSAPVMAAVAVAAD
jgi:hypothetical protein